LNAIVLYEEQHAVLRCTGDEDRASQALRRPAMSRALNAERDLVVDLDGLWFADPSLMVDLAMVARRMRKCGRCMVIRGASEQIHTLIELVGLHRLPCVVVDGPSPAAV